MSEVKTGFESPSRWLETLRELPRRYEAYQEAIDSVDFDIEAIRRFCFFREEFYTRNLIVRTDGFELLALCWAPGQTSPVHDHAGSDGWIRAMEGRIEEVWFEVREREDGSVELERGRGAELTSGATSYIKDELAWHRVGNPADVPAVTLHLYSPPIDRCRYVDPATGEMRFKTMQYHSTNGILVEA